MQKVHPSATVIWKPEWSRQVGQERKDIKFPSVDCFHLFRKVNVTLISIVGEEVLYCMTGHLGSPWEPFPTQSDLSSCPPIWNSFLGLIQYLIQSVVHHDQLLP